MIQVHYSSGGHFNGSMVPLIIHVGLIGPMYRYIHVKIFAGCLILFLTENKGSLSPHIWGRLKWLYE